MTIGQELEKRTDMTLFHKHETIDFVLKFVPMSEDARELITTIRFDFLESFAKTGQEVIFTVVIDFNDPHDIYLLEELQTLFEAYNHELSFVELETDLEERLRRKKTENRLKHKPFKRDIEWSENDILSTMAFAHFKSEQAPEKLKNYYKINNTKLTAKETALQIAHLLNKEVKSHEDI